MATWTQAGVPSLAGYGSWESAKHGVEIFFIPTEIVVPMQIFNTVTKTWRTGNPPSLIPSKRMQMGAVSYGEYIYCFGGRGTLAQTTIYRDIFKYHVANNSWSNAGQLQTAVADIEPASVGNYIFIAGGHTTPLSGIYNATDRIQRYNPVNETTSYYSISLDEKTESASGVAVSNILYVIGGEEIVPLTGTGTIGVDTIKSSKVYVIDTSSEKVTMGQSAPTAGTGYAGAYLGEILRGVTRSLEKYSTSNDSWIIDGNYPPNQAKLFVIRDYLYSVNYQAIYELSLATAVILNPSPTGGFSNEKINNTFSWNLQSSPTSLSQQSATFQWRARGASTINTISIGTAQNATVPANTLPNGEFEWRVSATNTAGIVASFTEWFLLTTIDERPNRPTGLYPNTGSRDGTKVIQFSWLHNSPLSTPQSAFELQMTYDGGYAWRALSNKVTTSVTQFTAAANIIIPTDPTGRIGWRVRTYNSDNVESDWSDTAFFIVHPAPQTPNWIGVETGRSRPLARWTSLGQVGFQLQVLSGETVLFDSGETFGTQTEYRIPAFLNNGVYNFRIRIKNVRGLYSAWANRSVSINARHSLNITLRGAPVEGGVALNFEVEVRAGG